VTARDSSRRRHSASRQRERHDWSLPGRDGPIDRRRGSEPPHPPGPAPPAGTAGAVTARSARRARGSVRAIRSQKGLPWQVPPFRIGRTRRPHNRDRPEPENATMSRDTPANGVPRHHTGAPRGNRTPNPLKPHQSAGVRRNSLSEPGSAGGDLRLTCWDSAASVPRFVTWPASGGGPMTSQICSVVAGVKGGRKPSRSDAWRP
jgi:hypothetical protein